MRIIRKFLLPASILMSALFLSSCATEPTMQPMPLSKVKSIPLNVLALATRAYENAKCAGDVRSPYLTIVDFQKPASQKRLWVIDMGTRQVLFYTYVAHGKNSGKNYATHFSNKMNSLESSIGVMQTGFGYQGEVGYSMKIYGLEAGVNDNLEKRLIVMHGASYVSGDFLRENGYIGHTWGCFGVNPQLVRPLINTIDNGSIIFAYYPDKHWLEHSPFLNRNYCQKTVVAHKTHSWF